ncbi:hypothetical protein [Streptomyces sp. NPDC089799]|uniref:hypothetical protein n=1 Tax=Streptomyces sp. NPDC089799 TaxID=3155066 RepID=UPI003430BEF8
MGGHEGHGTHTRRRALRTRGCAVAALLALALAGCSADKSAKGSGPSPNNAAPGTPAPDPSGTQGTQGAQGKPGAPSTVGTPSAAGKPTSALIPPVDEAKQPRTAAEARALVGRILLDQTDLGQQVTRSTPFESDPAHWAVLDQECVWQTGGLPADVLASRTRYFHIPARDGRGTVRINATVTVHRTREESGWETARAMEEVLRCPDQKLREGEGLQKLIGNALYYGDELNGWTEDAFAELGEYVNTADGGKAYPYTWSQAQYGPVTLAVAVKGSEGYTKPELQAFVVQGTSHMSMLARQALGKAAG